MSVMATEHDEKVAALRRAMAKADDETRRKEQLKRHPMPMQLTQEQIDWLLAYVERHNIKGKILL